MEVPPQLFVDLKHPLISQGILGDDSRLGQKLRGGFARRVGGVLEQCFGIRGCPKPDALRFVFGDGCQCPFSAIGSPSILPCRYCTDRSLLTFRLRRRLVPEQGRLPRNAWVVSPSTSCDRPCSVEHGAEGAGDNSFCIELSLGKRMPRASARTAVQDLSRPSRANR